MISSQDMIQNSKAKNSRFGKPHPKVKFTPAEDARLRSLVYYFGDRDWNIIANVMVGRNPRQCRERWVNYLSPNVNNSPWTPEEDALLIQKHAELGPKWVKISKFFTARTDTHLKSRWLLLQRRNPGILNVSKPQTNKIESDPAPAPSFIREESSADTLSEDDFIAPLDFTSSLFEDAALDYWSNC